MMGQQVRSESLFYYFKLDDYIPENHLLRLIDQHLSFAFVRDRIFCGAVRYVALVPRRSLHWSSHQFLAQHNIAPYRGTFVLLTVMGVPQCSINYSRSQLSRRTIAWLP